MTTLTCNTLTGAVSEYDWPAFQSITPTHAGAATGLFALGGETDAGTPIISQIRLPGTLRESTLKKAIKMAYISMRGAGSARFTVHGAQQSWSYDFPVRPSGQSRCQVGKGIKENYLGFSLSNPGGQAFTLDRVEIMHVPSNTRRV